MTKNCVSGFQIVDFNVEIGESNNNNRIIMNIDRIKVK